MKQLAPLVATLIIVTGIGVLQEVSGMNSISTGSESGAFDAPETGGSSQATERASEGSIKERSHGR